MQDDATVILTMLDQQLRYLLDQEKERRLLQLPRFLRFLQSEPRVAALVADMREESAEALAQLAREDAQVRGELGELWKKHEADLRRILAGIPDEDLNSYGTMDTYEATLRKTSAPDVAGDTRWPSTDPVSALRHWTLSAQQHAEQTKKEVPDGFADVLRRLERLVTVQQHHARTFATARENLAGAAVARLMAIAEKVNPRPPNGEGDYGARLRAVAAFGNLDDFATLVHEPHRPQSGHYKRHHVDAEVARVALDARLVHEELRQRVLNHRA
jgi:hypothetical protein